MSSVISEDPHKGSNSTAYVGKKPCQNVTARTNTRITLTESLRGLGLPSGNQSSREVRDHRRVSPLLSQLVRTLLP